MRRRRRRGGVLEVLGVRIVDISSYYWFPPRQVLPTAPAPVLIPIVLPMKPSVSVIMNVQNGETYLREAMDSVFAQDFEDWELIVWDDCSTDSTPEIVHSYHDPRMQYIRSPNLVPLGRARQIALNEARGEWVGYLDQDDIWEPHKLRLQVELGSLDPQVGLVYGRTLSFDGSGRRQDFDHKHEYEPLPEGDIFERLFHEACFIAMSAILFRRSALQELGAVPEQVRMIPDYYMLLGVSEHHEARAVEQVICHYRWHADNMTFRYYKELHHECLWLIDHWSDALDPGLAAHRRRVHQTNIAYKELQQRQTMLQGLARLVQHGSVPYLLTRPFARTFRSFRRRVQRPYWLGAA